ncbi:MAG: glycosyltransferase family 4 protein [Candidatus Elarobacter sp.]
MRALLVVRPDAGSRPGGDVVHAEHALRALRTLDVDATLVATDAPDPRGYDVAHVFGVFAPETAARQIGAIRRAGIPLVLSPIWLDLRALFATAPQIERALTAGSPAGVQRRLARLRVIEQRLPWQGSIARNADRRAAQQRELVSQADVLLPASEVEAYLYGERLRVAQVPFVVAPLGVDADAFAVERASARRGVLCAARIEPKKNQALLLYALRDVDVEITLVGQAHDAPYLALCRRWATSRTRFVDHATRADVLAMMARCAVHAHPSWLESPGLSSLEAAATGARVVTGDRGCEREYFGPEIDYADPADPESIHDAVVRALEHGTRERDDDLERRLAARTWQHHAEATLDAYTRAIAAHHARP